jgi:hypothetical protein
MSSTVTPLPRRTPAVQLRDGSLTVDGWTSTATDVIRLFERPDGEADPVALFDRVVHTGALALSAANSALDLHTVDLEFGRLSTRLEQVLEEQLGSVAQLLDRIFLDETGTLRGALDRYLGEGGSLADMFDPDRRSSAIGRLNQILEEHFGGRGSKMYQLLDHTDPVSPIRAWHHELVAKFDELKRQLEDYRKEAAVQLAAESAAAAEHEKGSLKGREFEHLAFDVIDDLARALGDTVEPLGDVAGLGGSKIGDLTVGINERDTGGRKLRLVVEAKDREVGLTPILRELDNAMDNRDGCAAIAVYSADHHAPRGASPFRAHGNRYLCVLDKSNPENTAATELAYRAARYWAIAEHARAGAEVDAECLAEDLAVATAKLKAFSDLKRQVTKIHKTVSDGTTALSRSIEELHADLREIFERLDGRVRRV